MKPYFKDIISAHAGQIFKCLDFDELKAIAGYDKAVEIKAVFLKIYRDQAPDEAALQIRIKALEAFLVSHGKSKYS